MKRLAFALALAAAACGGQGQQKSPYIAGFTPPAVPAGYTRYVTPPVSGIKPGEDIQFCQWLTGQATEDTDVIDLTGAQSKYGHHVALYASAMHPKVGTTRECSSADMSSIRYVGAIGAEGTTNVKLPPGYIYRIPKGYALMANVHFINFSHETISGQSVLDVKTRAPEPTDTVADIVTNLDTSLEVPPGVSQFDVNCPVTSDMTVVMWANHMHENGTSIYSEVIHEDGSKDVLVADNPWQKEEIFDPTYKTFPSDDLLQLHPGDTLHTHCEWNNKSGQTLPFGLEMCVGVGFYVKGGTGMMVCDHGQWSSQ